MRERAKRASAEFEPTPDPTYGAVFETTRNWTQVCREYERRHPGERMSKQHAKQIHDVAIWKFRVALGLASNVPSWTYRNAHGIDMSALEAASA